MISRPSRYQLFPYTTLFRSVEGIVVGRSVRDRTGNHGLTAQRTYTAHRRRSVRTLGGKDRKSTRLNSSHGYISYAVFCFKKKNSNDRTKCRTTEITNAVSIS